MSMSKSKMKLTSKMKLETKMRKLMTTGGWKNKRKERC